MSRWPWPAALVLLHAGGTSLTAGPRAPLDDRQGFADRVTPPYGVADVTFLVGEQPGPGVEARRVGVPAGHPVDTCVEINDLIRRYPTDRDISDSCPWWPEPRWADPAAQRDAMSSAPLDPR
jgi:hypothetical protein